MPNQLTRALLVVALAGLTLSARASLGQVKDATPTVVVRVDQQDGKFDADRYANVSTEALNAQVLSPLSDAVFQWIRASNAVAYVRCPTWLGDGIAKSHPDGFAGARVLRPGPNGFAYQFEDLERVLDTLLTAGVKPVIVCGGLPDLLVAGNNPRRNESGAAINRPRDYARYQELMVQLFKRLQKTYGSDEIRTWYFEVWSQPDHQGSWEGGRPAPFTGEPNSESVNAFLKMYDHFAAAADSVDPRLRIGGPGLAGDPAFLRRFLAHCTREISSATGKKGIHLDFVSWQAYGSNAEIIRRNEELRAVAAEFTENVEFIMSEGGLKPSAGSAANTAAEAARLAALIDATSRSGKGVDRLFRSGDLVDEHFNGFRPLVSLVGGNTVPTAAMRLYMALAKLGPERLKTELPPGVGAIATRPNQKLTKNAAQVLLYRYDEADPTGAAGKPQKVLVRFAGLPNTLLRLPARVYRIDKENHSAFDAWKAAGSPNPAPVELGKQLVGTETFQPATYENGLPINSGETSIEVTVPPNGVVLITLSGEPIYGVDNSDRVKHLEDAAQDFEVAYSLAREGNATKSIDELRKVAAKYADTHWREEALRTIAAIYELGLKSPEQAEAVRKELLALPLDDFVRVGLLERLRIDAVRKKDKRASDDYTRQIAAIQKHIAEQKVWPLKRYYGE